MNKVTLYEEFRLIEKCETEVNGAWRGAHLLLFFLAFVFGCFCTFCFHMLMYLFDEKCVLFPKLLSLTSNRHNIIYEFIPTNDNEVKDLPVDFLSTQWVEKNACTLPTYVPLLSGIFGLVWTTMFLMCSTGSRTLTGLQRPWRVLPPVFVFSLAMGSLCVYSSAVTHYGLQELCYKLGEISGSSTCTYTVNVATLAYERRIRGVYQATRLTILAAWLHTGCWLLSALLALVRVLLVVDFQLVRVHVDLRGDIDNMLQRHERQLRTVSPDPDLWSNNDHDSIGSPSSTRVHFDRNNQPLDIDEEPREELKKKLSDILFFSDEIAAVSEQSLVPTERNRLARQAAYNKFPVDNHFIIDMLYDILDTIVVAEMPYTTILSSSSSQTLSNDSESTTIVRQIGQEKITSKRDQSPQPAISSEEAEELATAIQHILRARLNQQLTQHSDGATSSAQFSSLSSLMNIADDLRLLLELEKPQEIETNEEEKSVKKSNLKTVGMQTDKPKGKVQISVSATTSRIETNTNNTNTANDTKDEDEGDDDKKSVQEGNLVSNVDRTKADELVEVFKTEDNVGISFKEDDMQVLYQSDVPKTDTDTEVAKKELVAKKDDGINIYEKRVDDNVNIESTGEASGSPDAQTENTGSEDVAIKQTQAKPKEKQD